MKKVVDDVKNTLSDSGRVVVRVSGTEPLVRVMLEGENMDQIEKFANLIADVVRNRLA